MFQHLIKLQQWGLSDMWFTAEFVTSNWEHTIVSISAFRCVLLLSSFLIADDVSTIADLFAEADNTLFKRLGLLSNESHVLRALLAEKSSHGYNLRNRHHNRQLTRKSTGLG